MKGQIAEVKRAFIEKNMFRADINLDVRYEQRGKK